MKFLLNLVWLLLAGIWLAFGYAVAGLLWAVTIIGLPYALASFRIAGYALWPFGRSVIRQPEAGAGSVIGNIIWFLFPGWILALAHVLTALAQAVTIIGLPFAFANLKMVPLALFPFGKVAVSNDELTEAMRAAAVSTMPAEPGAPGRAAPN